jgi:hypothetical protein
MIGHVAVTLCFLGAVASNPILPPESPRVIFTLSTLLNISKMIDEANRCPSQTQNTLCSWAWVPDIKETRIPRVIYRAGKHPESPCEGDPSRECRSQNKAYNVMYLALNSRGIFDLLPRVEEHPVAMECVDKERDYVMNGEDVAYNMFD